MKQEYNVADNKVNISLAGSMYVEDAAVFRERLMDFANKGQRLFHVDMSGMDYIDSSGLGVLVAMHKMALQKGGELVLYRLRGVVKELFELTRLIRVFDIRE